MMYPVINFQFSIFNFQKKTDQSGVTLLLSILVLSAIMAISFSLAAILLVEVRVSGDLLRTEPAIYSANAVTEEALFAVRRNYPRCFGENCENQFHYTTQIPGSLVKMDNPNPPVENLYNDPVLVDEVLPTSNSITNTLNRYALFDPTNINKPSPYTELKVTFKNTGSGGTIHIYVCQYDSALDASGNPNPFLSFEPVDCNTPTSPDMLYQNVGPSGQDQGLLEGQTTITMSFSSPNKQQELIIYTSGGDTSKSRFVQIEGFTSGSVPKGIPYFGETVVDIHSQYGSITRALRVKIPGSSASSGGPASGFAHHRQISLNFGQVSGGGPLSNFPVLVNFTDATLKSVDNGGNVQSNNGTDIVFTSDAAGTNIIPYEQEKYDPTTGQIIYWVKIASLSDSSVFYMFYGKSGATDQQNVAGVWIGNFGGVYHLYQNPTGAPPQLTDSDAGGVHLTTTYSLAPSTVSGKIGNAAFFPNDNQYISKSTANSSANSGTGSGSRSITGWVKLSALPSAFLDDKARLISTNAGMYIEVTTGNKVVGGIIRADQLDNFNATGATSLSANTWYYFAAVYTSSPNQVRIYLNGVSDGTVSVTDAVAGDGVIRLSSGTYRWIGATYDEVRFHSTGLSADWIKTEYNNQSNPSVFYTVGPEQ